MITLNIKKDREHVDIRFPCSEKVITDALKKIGVNDELDTKQTVSEVVDFESLSLLEGQDVDLDEINYLAKRLDSLTKPEVDKFIVVSQMEGLDEPKDLINLTYNLNRYPISADGMYRVRVSDRAGNEVSVEFTIDKTVDYEINVYDKGLSNSVVATTHEIVTTELTKDGEKVDYAIGSAINQVGDYTLVLTDALGNKEVITFRIIQPKVQEFTHNFDDIEGFGGVLVNGEDKRLNYGTLELFDDGAYEVGVIVSGKTYTFNVTVDGTAPTLKLNGVENGGITKDGVKLTNVSETAELKVFKDGKEIKYKFGDELTEVGKYKATLTDECGNQTTYEFEIEKSVNGWLIAFIIIGVLVLAGGVTVFILKKKEII